MHFSILVLSSQAVEPFYLFWRFVKYRSIGGIHGLYPLHLEQTAQRSPDSDGDRCIDRGGTTN